MSKNFNIDNMGIFGIVIGLAGILFAGWQAKKTDDICKKLGTSMDEVEKNTNIDIQDSIVHKAVEKVAEREAKGAVVDAVNKVRDDINSTISTKVTTAVNENLDAIESAVEAKAQELVGDIDKVAFQKKITDQGAKILSGEFSGSLNGMLADAKSKISYMTNTISGLAEAFMPIRKTSGSGVNFHID